MRTAKQKSPRILPIGSKNAAFQKFEVLKTNRNKRHRYQQFFLEGVRNINQALENQWPVDAWLYSEEKSLSGWASQILHDHPAEIHYVLSEALMQDVSSKTDRSELCAIVRMRNIDGSSLVEHPSIADGLQPPVFVLFDRPSNKGNLGTVIRTCDGFGIQGLVITGHAVDPYDPETIAATTGSFFKLPFSYVPDNKGIESFIALMRRRWPDLCVAGTSESAEKPLYAQNLKKPLLIIIGNETDGMSMFCQSLCDLTLEIPMHALASATSFNVACAASIVLYETVRQRLTS